MDVALVMASDMEVGTRVQTMGCPLSDWTMELQQLYASTTLRMVFRPIIAQVPYIAGVIIHVRCVHTSVYKCVYKCVYNEHSWKQRSL